MAILVNKGTKAMIQGITGKQGMYHAKKMLEYGSDLVAGVTPNKGGQNIEGVPVYNTVKEALENHSEINASLVLVPPKFVKASATEAIEAGIKLVVLITEFVPVHDSMEIVELANEKGAKVVGPNTIGVISPGISKVGIMPGYIYSQGNVGIISRSGTLTHEMASNLTHNGIGQSTCIGIGGDPVIGMTHREALEIFRDDEDTEAVVLIGEIGGVGEELAAQYMIDKGYPKPVYAFIAGRTAPEGKKMGHAGAIVSGNMGTAKSKISMLNKAGVQVADTLGQVVDMLEAALVR
jgi:succinyl-CoA synthetase alpha subunit